LAALLGAEEKTAQASTLADSPAQQKPSRSAKDATSVNIFTGIGMITAENYVPLTRKQR
jgi:hypothetical protein